MKKLLLSCILALTSSVAFAQTAVPARVPAPERADGFPPNAMHRPYWVDRPIIEVLGRATLEFAPNRVSFSVVVEETNSDADVALSRVAARARPAIEKVQGLIGHKGRLSVTYTREELYQQYRDREGNRVENTREDKIENYVARYIVHVQLDDATLLPTIKAELLAVGNAKMQMEAQYEFVPSPEQARTMFRAATVDGAERAKIVADAHRGRLKLLLIEEGTTQCIGQATGPVAVQVEMTSPVMYAPVSPAPEMVTVTGSRRKLTSQELIMPAAPNFVRHEAQVCMIYAIEQ